MAAELRFRQPGCNPLLRTPAQLAPLRVLPYTAPLASVYECPLAYPLCECVCVGGPRYFPCTVDWFLARCEVVEVRRGWRRRVLRVLERAGELTGAGLQARPARLRVWVLRVLGRAGELTGAGLQARPAGLRVWDGRRSWENLCMFEQACLR